MTDNFASDRLKWYHSSLNNIIRGLSACIFIIISFYPFISNGQDEPEYDEISVFFNVQRFGGAEINAVIKNNEIYLPVSEVFSFLKIKNTVSKQLDSISGFFLNQQSLYLIDKAHERIIFQGKTFQLKPGDMVRTETNLYLKSEFFGQIFGLDCSFNFRSLAVSLTTKLELPVIREMRQEQMRTNISRLKGELKADTAIGRTYPFFSVGMADWSVIASQQLKGKDDARFNFTLGSVFAGGETNISLNYNMNTRFTEKEQYYLWRFVNNDHRALRQVSAGKITTPVTSSIFNPILGFQLTNTPTTYRRSFGTYTLSDITEPNWIVELYVNSVLVDYVKSDASGFFKFEVPLVYGNSAVMLRFYGPWGEEKTREVNISIPFNFLPYKEFEYNVSGGIIEDSLNSRFSRAMFNYGLHRRITMGAGVEYLSSVTSGTTMPFINTSVRLGSSLLLNGEYTYGVRFRGLMSYRLPSNLQLDVNYSRYEKGQKAIIYNYLEERKAVISAPIKRRNFSAYTRLTFNQIVMKNLKNTSAELLLSGTVFGVNTNFTTYGLYTDPSNPYIYSNLALAFKLPSRITFTPQVQYEYILNDVIATKANLEKPLFNHGFLNISYEQNFKSRINNVEFGLRYDFPFAQTGFSTRQSNEITTFVESARGSLLYDSKNRYLAVSNRTSVGKGAITFIPFLDLNCNNRYDTDEPRVAGLGIRVDGGRVQINDRDTTIRVVDLIPYTSYYVELDRNSFENISWQIRKKTMSVTVDANRFKTIEIPVAVMGEVSGTIYFKGNNNIKGQGQILINFYRNDSLISHTMSEQDGYFSLLGLPPGSYIARIDTAQLRKVKMKVSPLTMPVSVRRTRDGDVIDGLEFTLETTAVPVKTIPEQLFVAKTDSTKVVKATPEIKTVSPQAGKAIIAVPDSTKVEKARPVTKAIRDSVLIRKQQTQPAVQIAGKVKKDSIKPEKITPVTKAVKDTALKGKAVERMIKPAEKPAINIDESGTQIQIGAFLNRLNASKALNKLEKAAGRKGLIIFEGGYYKVRIGGFKNRIDATAYLPTLVGSGFKDAFVVVFHQGIVIQVNAFINQANALAEQKKVILETGRSAVIDFEDGFYKVRISGFSGRLEAEAFLPKLKAKGYKDAFIVRGAEQ